MLRIKLPALLVSLVLVPPAFAQPHPEMGRMWTFENIPSGYFEAAYDFVPDQEWLDRVRLAALKFGGGCSASFVSPRGLIMTNHHCARAFVARASPPGEDYLANGFFARNPEEEVRLADLSVRQLVRMEDVTARVLDGVSDGDAPRERSARMRSNQEAILAAAGETGLVAEIVSLYQGGMFQLYFHRVWNDIRLVASPHLQSAKFGGDPDNFTYPRFSLDFALVRAYENGEPADTASHYLRFKTEGPSRGETVFVVGNPGSTGRLNTVAQMERMRDATYPVRLRQIEDDLSRLEASAAADVEVEVQQRANILRLQNARKAFRGFLDGLRNESVMGRKRAAEAALRERIAANPGWQSRFGRVFEDLESISADLKRAEWVRSLYTQLGDSRLDAGFHLARLNDETTSPRDRRQSALALNDFDPGPGDRRALASRLAWMRTVLPRDDSVLAALLGDLDADSAVAALLDGTVLRDRAAVDALRNIGQEAFARLEDPVLVAGRLRANALAEAQEIWTRRRADESAASQLAGEAIAAVYGVSIPPDATGTLRISDGVVAGFPCNGTVAPWFTSLYGLYARHAEFEGAPPFDLDPVWDSARERLDLRTRFNFVATCDVIGGNSGSPVVDREGRFVGLVFDGNIESLANRFVFTDEVARTVCVHPAIIALALREVLDLGTVADELEGR